MLLLLLLHLLLLHRHAATGGGRWRTQVADSGLSLELLGLQLKFGRLAQEAFTIGVEG